MATMKDRYEAITDLTLNDTLYVDDSKVLIRYPNSNVIVYRRYEGRGCYRYYSSTHWSEILELNLDDDPRPEISWASGGKCQDAGSWEIARAMKLAFEDAEAILDA